ncbi:GNAT family N-acetyltransferase [Paractinoplanes rishiriensis]|uniref:N-acetyltransferase domain-containing protein n=1 Tax=Paractinoplanes rishiriensis TaxID=1050105 RepID=A0A919JY06_9ACTN|nr:GNAT family N-acetyltransferase [Actinoplanes rishiriensis]GIE97306.1 hypothetical protein Ari01nite_47710 [Actinoplanes rishiriensis]
MRPVTFHYYRGRVALHAILRGLGVAPGDEVVVQAYTCAAVVEPLRRLGVTPVFVDIDPLTYGLDAGKLAAALTGRTRAVIVQHTFGIPVDMAAVTAVAGPAGVPVIEDCAHVTGPVTVRGVAAFFSYEWGKPIVAGVGGTAVVADPDLAATMRRQYARYREPPLRRELIMQAQYTAHRTVSRLGVTWRLRDLYRKLAGLGLVVGSYAADPGDSPEYAWRMTRTVRWRLGRRTAEARKQIARRTDLTHRYRAGLEQLSLLTPPPTGAPLLRMPVPVTDKAGIVKAAARQRIEVGDWFTTPVHPLSGEALAAAGYTEGTCPNAEWAANHVISFPIRAGVRDADADRGVGLLADWMGEASGLPRIRIRGGPFTDEQVRAVARMHATEVAQGFLSSLGVPALELLYRHVAASKYCAMFVAERGNEPVGYICGTRDTAALYREFVLHRWWVAVPALAPKLLRPSRIARTIETLRYPRAAMPADLPRAEVINFVVHPDCRGLGVAQALFRQLTRWFADQGETAVKIVTGEQQGRAHGFYEKSGAALVGRTSVHRGVPSRIYRYGLDRVHT